MKSLGVIETQGLVAAIQAVDAACKAAEVSCIGYRKIGSGLVSVCFEGEISAIITAVERGVEIAGTQHPVNSLVIARPERSVVDALTTLKGYSSHTEVNHVAAPQTELAPQPEITAQETAPTPQPTSHEEMAALPLAPTDVDHKAQIKKGKKA